MTQSNKDTDTPLVAAEPARKRQRPVRADVRRTRGARYKARPIDEGPIEWHLRLRKLFGTMSPEFAETCLRQLLRIAKLPNEVEASRLSLSAAFALISSLAPEDEAQAVLAVHVACLHMASIKVLTWTDHCTLRNVVPAASAAAKLERAFQTALESYYRLRRGGTQIVRVERVEIQPGAQAIVGVVKN